MKSIGSDSLHRVNVFDPAVDNDVMLAFKARWNNLSFRTSTLSWLSLVFLIILYPGISVIFAEDPATLLGGLNEGMLMVVLVSTIVMQWSIFMGLYVTTYRERTGLAGLGFKRVRWLDLAWAVAFLLGANLILSGLAWLLAQIGLPMSGEIAMLIPTDPVGRIVWVAVAITAGVCEETAFRGYLMTRLKLMGGFQSWVLPTIISAVAFGACHAYQGLPGFIVITVYGTMFSLLYIRTGSIWPGIFAHFFQDFGALFIPQ